MKDQIPTEFEPIEVTVLDEADLLTQIREHFAEAATTPGEALAATP